MTVCGALCTSRPALQYYPLNSTEVALAPAAANATLARIAAAVGSTTAQQLADSYQRLRSQRRAAVASPPVADPYDQLADADPIFLRRLLRP